MEERAGVQIGRLDGSRVARVRDRTGDEAVVGAGRFSTSLRLKPADEYPRLVALADQDVRSVFLKLCFEFDDSDTLDEVRKGLLLVVKALGASWVARSVGVNRVSLYLRET